MAQPAPRRRLFAQLIQACRRVGLVGLTAYALLLALLFFSQAGLIFPGSQTQGQPFARVSPPEGAEIVSLRTSRGDRVAALFGRALTPSGSPVSHPRGCPTLLYFYGNGMCLRDALEEFEQFRRLGANVLVPDYPGYGMSEGRAGEAGCYAAADAAYDHLVARADVDPRRIVAAGWSLGAAVAVDLASRKELAGVAAFSAFTSMADMASRHYPFVPVPLLLRHRFESERKIARVRCPVLLAHGTEDTIIPYAMADRLAAAAGGPVTRVPVEGADHNDFFTVGGDPLLGGLREFLSAL